MVQVADIDAHFHTRHRRAVIQNMNDEQIVIFCYELLTHVFDIIRKNDDWNTC